MKHAAISVLNSKWTILKKISTLFIIYSNDFTHNKICHAFLNGNIVKDRTQYFQVVGVSILQYGCSTWTLTKRMEKKLDDNYTKMLWIVLNKSREQYPTKQRLYSRLSTITKTIQVRRTRYEGHCCRNKNQLISDIFLWIPSQRQDNQLENMN